MRSINDLPNPDNCVYCNNKECICDLICIDLKQIIWTRNQWCQFHNKDEKEYIKMAKYKAKISKKDINSFYVLNEILYGIDKLKKLKERK